MICVICGICGILFTVSGTRASRRQFLRTGAVSVTSALFLDPLDSIARLGAQPLCPGAGDLGTLEGLVPLFGDRPRATPFGEMVGGPGLDARLFTDLSTLEPHRLITATDRVFVRTAAPQAVAARLDAWTIAVTPGKGRPSTLTLADLERLARPMGAHLIECAGNNDPNNFGLMSAAEWHGVPLADVVGIGDSSGVLVGGIDDESRPAWRSVPGASWILPAAELQRLGAFLAIGMNGGPLTPDHGAPVRLVVPGWYGCSWIKWVDTIRAVSDDEPATSQMREFAARTHQDGVPALARDYRSPAIDLAATPVRVEKRRLGGRPEYRIVGIAWGGTRPVDGLTIRFRAGEEPRHVAVCPPTPASGIWTLWDYRWRPVEAGTYDIVVKAADPAVQTRRLDLSFYLRRVTIDEV